MKRIVKALLILIPVAVLVHDAGSGRLRTFRPFRDDRYTPELLGRP